MNWNGAWLDYTVNGLVIGNIYALLAVGLALIFGVANLINFAHGSIYTLGAYLGWTCIVVLHLPLPVAIPLVLLASAALGVLRSLGRDFEGAAAAFRRALDARPDDYSLW